MIFLSYAMKLSGPCLLARTTHCSGSSQRESAVPEGPAGMELSFSVIPVVEKIRGDIQLQIFQGTLRSLDRKWSMQFILSLQTHFILECYS